jgi:hypothetical protein
MALLRTRARLRPSITLRVFPEIADVIAGKKSTIAKYVTELLTGNETFNNLTVIGEARDFRRTQKRDVFKRYNLGTNSYEPFQVIPLKVDTQLVIERVALYKSDAMKIAFGFFGEHLLHQLIPITIVEEKHSPDDNIDEMAINFYTGCWATTNPVEYSIDASDMWILKDVVFECGQVISLDLSVGGIATVADEALGATEEILGQSETI